MTSESDSEEYLRSMGLSPLGWDAGKGLGSDDLVNYFFLFQSEPQECGGGKKVRVWWRLAGTLEWVDED